MAKDRILFVNQEIAPYTPSSPTSLPGRDIPQAMPSLGFEVRTFMPKYGTVNERRNQLHEVIRLSGANIMINDNDHPLILKVASMHPSRIQVYFIDNDDYFEKDDADIDVMGSNRADNDERIIFYARGVAETVKKLKWEPKIIQVTGWLSALTPLYLRQMFADNSTFANSKIVYEVTDSTLAAPLDPQFFDKLRDDNLNPDTLQEIENAGDDITRLHLLGMAGADGVVFNVEEPNPVLVEAANKAGIKVLTKEQYNLNDQPAQNLVSFYETL